MAYVTDTTDARQEKGCKCVTSPIAKEYYLFVFFIYKLPHLPASPHTRCFGAARTENNPLGGKPPTGAKMILSQSLFHQIIDPYLIHSNRSEALILQQPTIHIGSAQTEQVLEYFKLPWINYHIPSQLASWLLDWIIPPRVVVHTFSHQNWTGGDLFRH